MLDIRGVFRKKIFFFLGGGMIIFYTNMITAVILLYFKTVNQKKIVQRSNSQKLLDISPDPRVNYVDDSFCIKFFIIVFKKKNQTVALKRASRPNTAMRTRLMFKRA